MALIVVDKPQRTATTAPSTEPNYMKTRCLMTAVSAGIALLSAVETANAALLSVTQTGSNLDPIAPRIEPSPLVDEAFAFVDRTHELTSARFNATTGLLTTDTNGVLAGFPKYLIGLQYVANANDNRTAGVANDANSYLVTYTVDQPSIAYLMLDNRLNGTGSNVSGPNTADPDLGGSLAWVTNDGWTRVNTGISPNGQGDYVGIDEGGTVAGPDARTHHDLGAGIGLNQFYSIYSKQVTDSFVTRSIRMAAGSGNMYVVAVAAVPEPSTWALMGLGFMALLGFAKRRKN